ncbi:MAG TPA: SpoIIE family protein phosphatase [Acidimicrobiales bacterium]|nr:SpoIIE family protein phosphatase [Acidimicrobiales bacterium]
MTQPSVGDEAARLAFEDALRANDPVDLFDRAPCGYVTTLPDGLIVAVNQTFLTWTGHARGDLVGVRRFPELLNPGGRIYYDTHIAPMLAMQGSVREIAVEVVRADQGRIPVLVNAVMETDAAGRPALVRAALFGATERRSYERELLRATEAARAAEARAVALARTLQGTLIPPVPPEVPGLDVGAAYRPSGDGDEVGGDFYDVFQVAHDDWAVVIGDVAGKGVEAAVVTALARYTLRGAAVRSTAASEALAALNGFLVSEHVERFCTAVFLRMRRRGGGWGVSLACGGHLLPLLRRHGRAAVPVGAPGSLLGVLTEPDLVDVELQLAPGDCLLLVTDGVTEARGGAGFFGEDRLARAFDRRAGLGAAALAADLVAEVVDFQAGRARDDIAVVVLAVPTP